MLAEGGKVTPCQCHLAEGGDAYSPKAQAKLDAEPAKRALAPPTSGHVGQPGMAAYADGGPVDSEFTPVAQANDAEFTPQRESIPDQGASEPSDAEFTPVKDYSENKPNQDYATKALTATEGVAQGLLGPIATGGELALSKLGVPGLSAEEQKARAEANPALHYGSEAAALGASMFFGVGEAELAGQAALKASEFANLGKVGSAVVKGAVEGGLIQGGDEISNYLLGKPVDPTAVAAASVVGGAIGPVLGLISKGASEAKLSLEAINDSKIQSKVDSFMHGFGGASKGMSPEELIEAAKPPPLNSIRRGSSVLPPNPMENGMIRAGHKAYSLFQNQLPKAAAEGVAGAAAHAAGTGPLGYLAFYHVLGKPIEKLVTKAQEKFVAPALFKAIASGDTQGIVNTIKYAKAVGKGAASIAQGLEGVFKGGVTPAIDAAVDERDREKLDEAIQSGGVNEQLQTQQQMYAHGGEVSHPQPPALQHTEAVTSHYPEQATLLGAAKGRVSQYLNNIRPSKDTPKLPYDSHPDQATQRKLYERGLHMAISPLSILNRVKDGSVNPEDVQQFQALYPELHTHLAGELTKRMMQTAMDEERPAYKTRQGIATFLQNPVDSCMSQPNILAVQMTFAKQQAQTQPQNAQKPKRGTATLSKAPKQYETANQAVETRARQ